MILNDKIAHSNELIAWIKSRLKKQRAVLKESVVEVNIIKPSVLGARIGEKDQIDKRVYVFMPNQHLIILSQAGFDSFHDDKILQLIMRDLVK